MEKDRVESLKLSFFDNHTYALILIGRDAHIVSANAAAVAICRQLFAHDIYPGARFSDVIPYDEHSEFQMLVQSVLDGEGSPGPVVSIFHAPDGEETWYETTVAPVNRTADSPLLMTIFDVTLRKNTIDRLAQSERRFKALVQNSSGVIFVVDCTGIIRYASGSVSRYLGYEPAQMMGRNLELYVHRADTAAFNSFLSSVCAREKVILFAELQFVDKHGSTLYFNMTGANHAANPSIEGIILNMHDVTDSRQIDQVMQRIARQNELILETASEGIFGINPRGLVSFINPYAASLLGREMKDVFGSPYKEVFRSSNGTGADPRLEEAVNEGVTVDSVETVFLSVDGRPVPVEFSSTPIIEGGSVTGTVVTFNDISRRLEIEEQLRRAKDDAETGNRAKSEFLAAMSHEIRTPMNGILGFIEMLGLTDLTQEQRSFLSIVSGNAHHLLGLISDILDFSKIEKGKLDLENVPFFPAQESTAVIAVFGAQAAEKELTLAPDIDASIPCCTGDPLRFRQVIANLVSNAVKFTPAKGMIGVVVRNAGVQDGICRIEVSVSDSGIGIPVERQAAVFESFTQSDSSITRHYGGSGLGLSISARIVAMMGGMLELESREGMGSRFFYTVCLPVSSQLPDNAVAESVIPMPERKLRALVGEDSPDSRTLIRLMLSKLGVACDTAEDGNMAVEKYIRGTYDLVFMDGNMPVCDGVEAARIIRAYEKNHSLPRIPIIALSARAVKGDRDLFLESGMDDYLTKPVSLSAIRSAIDRNVKVKLSYEGGNYPEGDVPSEFRLDYIAEVLGILPEEAIGLISDFFASAEGYLSALRSAVKSGNLNEIAHASHKMRGISASYRLEGVSIVCAEMESAANRNMRTDYADMLMHIEKETERYKALFERAKAIR